ncbi:RAMP superfamily CRISPR-associated protein [Paenibacillus arenosi]|uniref:RAMP superfamily CRISPR-associated protein n=1 Tax=Paenibacillus arenosi TaxID=2774142 RepID=UPI001CDCA684|nr:RAMP superfamily CRISPR-associated protein [Paenibacillus arenosi]
MSIETIRFKVTTLSNLFIGGSPATFEIGGVDLFTVTDHEGNPYIPASSFKGSLRTIVRDIVNEGVLSDADEIKQSYLTYLKKMEKENEVQLEQMKIEDERKKKVLDRFERVKKQASAECLFGMEGFNHTPKLLFNDLRLSCGTADPFSIDSKNTIEISNDGAASAISANPRTYKTVRPGVQFAGEINMYMMNKLSIEPQTVRTFITHAIQQFNDGVYRLGNSGSRGYGKIQVEIIGEDE